MSSQRTSIASRRSDQQWQGGAPTGHGQWSQSGYTMASRHEDGTPSDVGPVAGDPSTDAGSVAGRRR